MKVGGSPGTQAMAQLMQSTNQITRLAAQQMGVAQQGIVDAKAGALQNSAEQLSQAVDRKGNFIDIMA